MPANVSRALHVSYIYILFIACFYIFSIACAYRIVGVTSNFVSGDFPGKRCASYELRKLKFPGKYQQKYLQNG